jgi:hypothetical protein
MASRIDEYKHLDKDTSMTITLPMEQIARECVALNYGSHRLLSALVHALRDANAVRAAKWEKDYPDEVYGPSELADGIEALLNKGLYS